MSSKRATAQAVAALYTAAGRNYEEAELVLYHRMFGDVDDGLLLRAVEEVIRGVDLGHRAPSPALVRETVRSILHREQLERAALPEYTGPTLSPEDNAARARALRDSIRAMKRTPESA